MYLVRHNENKLKKLISSNPVVAITGARQTGKSTLAKKILSDIPDSIYLDLEKPSDLRKLDDPEWFFLNQKDKLICLDEVQRKPDVFPVIRSIVDEWERNSCFLILGSASRELINRSSESLAGRIAYMNMYPFLWNELNEIASMEQYFGRGGFPKSVLAEDEEVSFEWRENFITTFLEKDLLQWSGFSSSSMRRLWQMLAHYSGQMINYSYIGNSLGYSNTTIRNYIDLLEATYMVISLPPYFSNLGKRLVKAPKIYISDSGITAALLGLSSFERLSGHPAFGSIWEQITLVNLKGSFPGASFFYYRTSNGAEIDLIMEYRDRKYAIECKSSLSPDPTKGNILAIEDIQPDRFFISAPVDKGWSLRNGAEIVSLSELIAHISSE